MTSAQILIIAFAVFALSRVVARFREGAINKSSLALWSAIWVAAIIVAVAPQTTSWLASVVGVGRGSDAVVYGAILIISYLIFRMYLRLEKIEHDITLLVRHIGLSKGSEQKKP